ncbi:hypothetical protein HZS55_09165 [Halosimplex rubrum]|uniref:Uncharacterized protein n=1 Tax=Halosimplex rubrum TaxID=869889 RepID=A0A7D5TNN0_9EURY|nr:hypothetical protein [Halosimplex rubrum]QLH77454.1 hypothetical protein HZS55_09165 [Halosimplex rubrum]
MRDTVEAAIRRAHSDALANTTVEVFEPDISHTQGEGWTVTYPNYPDTPADSYDARIESPESDTERERSGTTSEIDAVVKVRDDTGRQWTGFGQEQEAPAHLRDTADGTRYEVESVVDTHNGLVELEVTEWS